jgi:hypothetical protein
MLHTGGKGGGGGGGGGVDRKEEPKWLPLPQHVAAQRLRWTEELREQFEAWGIDGGKAMEESEGDLRAHLQGFEPEPAGLALGILKQLKQESELALEALPASFHESSLPVPVFSFRDHFAGTTESLPHIPLLPDEQAALAQVTRPLQLMRAAAWFLGRRWPAAGHQRLRHQPLPPLDCLRDGCAARVPARVMFGCVATACRRMASAPGDGTTWRLAGWVMERVSRGLVRRGQVQPQRRAAVSLHMCVFCNRLLQQTLADVQVAHCKAPQQHALRCRTPCFPAHALFAVCRRRQSRTLRCARQTRGERSRAACSPNLREQTSRH